MSSRRIAGPLAVAVIGCALIYAGVSSFEKTDGIPTLILEGMALASGLMLLSLAAKQLLRQEAATHAFRERHSVTPNEFPVQKPAVDPSYWYKPVVARVEDVPAALDSYPFVERRKGGDRRTSERRQNISWASDSRQGPGRRRNNGRRSTDRMDYFSLVL